MHVFLRLCRRTPASNWRDGLFWLIFAGLNLGLFVLPRR